MLAANQTHCCIWIRGRAAWARAALMSKQRYPWARSFQEARSESFQQDDAPTRSADLLKPKIFRRNVLLQSKLLREERPARGASQAVQWADWLSPAPRGHWLPQLAGRQAAGPCCQRGPSIIIIKSYKVFREANKGISRRQTELLQTQPAARFLQKELVALVASPLKLVCLKSQAALSPVSSQVFLNIFQWKKCINTVKTQTEQ